MLDRHAAPDELDVQRHAADRRLPLERQRLDAVLASNQMETPIESFERLSHRFAAHPQSWSSSVSR